MKPYMTEDNSLSFYSEEYGEYYHSKTGALEEAFGKYAYPSGISVFGKESLSILDFCFGLGYNSLAGIVEAKKNLCIKQIKVVGIELDPEILGRIEDIVVGYEEYSLIKRAVEKGAFSGMSGEKKVDIEVLNKDARDALPELSANKNKFDLVFFDPFSPKRCPELWTEDIFSKVFSLMNKGGKLMTYSCARLVRDNMKKAGFSVSDGPSVGRRGPSTIGTKVDETGETNI